MCYPEDFEKKIEFSKIKEILITYCQNSLAIQYVKNILFSSNLTVIEKSLHEVAEFTTIIKSNLDFPNDNFYDFSSILKHVSLDNHFLELEEFDTLKKALRTFFKCILFFESEAGKDYQHLKTLIKNIDFNYSLLRRIESVFDEKGLIKDNASPQLKEIRKKIYSHNKHINDEAFKYLKYLKKQNISSPEANPTIREARTVIPIYSEFKRKIKGIIHGISVTGQTTFIEPENLIHVNNESHHLSEQERLEVIKILTHLTLHIRTYIPDLKEINVFLAKIDFIKAKARLAIDLKAVKPNLLDKTILDWKNAKHPLLMLNNPDSHEQIKIQGNEIKIKDKQRIILISGPNAGGKSVTLKTVGLIQYMLQCGLLIPVEENSVAGIFKRLFVDIGDEQSIESNLSTYSSHLKNMNYFLRQADEECLCLIDEFGSGTDPQFGGAIAAAILSKLNQKKTYGIFSTHYTNLKFLAEDLEYVCNGAMLFDVQKLRPYYKLSIGESGHSFALEIAEKVGLEKDIIQTALYHIDKKHIDTERLSLKLQQRNKTLEEQVKAFKEKEIALHENIKYYDKQLLNLSQKRDTILQNAEEEAKKIHHEALKNLNDANRKIEYTIRDIREKQAEKEHTKKLRTELKIENQIINDKLSKSKKSNKARLKYITNSKIEPKDWVKLKDTDMSGQVKEIDKNKVTVWINNMQLDVEKKTLIKISPPQKSTSPQPDKSNHFLWLDKQRQTFNRTLDLKGFSLTDAKIHLEEYLNDAKVLEIQEFTIVPKLSNELKKITDKAFLKYTLKDTYISGKGMASVLNVKL